MLVAGRDGIVKEINNKGEWETPRNGSMFIAEIDFCVDVQGMMNIRVAAITDAPHRRTDKLMSSIATLRRRPISKK